MRQGLTVAVLACVLAAPAQAQLPEDPSTLLGAYGGSYVCAGREHGFHFDLTDLVPAADGGFEVKGIIGFFPILSGLDDRGTGPAGSFTASGTLAADGALSMKQEEWLFQALGYLAPDIEGRISVRRHGGFEIRGRPVVHSRPGAPVACSDLIATKFIPPPPPPAATPN